MYLTLDDAASRTPVVARVAALFDSLRQWQVKRAAYCAAYDELASLSDRELDDLNIGRGRIADEAREAAGLY